jgi:1-acyl-sn-glycerol-3-phosphate acyltransferase
VAESPLPGIGAAVGAQLLQLVGELADQLPEDAQRQLAEGLAVVRSRLTGDYPVDAYGFDVELTEKVLLPLFRPLYQRWFRVEVSGIEHVPLEGGALLVANHSGTVAMDAVMTQVAVHEEHPKRRHLRCLGGDLVFDLPVIGELARKSGSTLACREDVDGLLDAGELVGVWPEGYKGSGKRWSDRYRLQRFGRGGFVSAAMRAQVPIIPCSIVGAEEIYPMIGDLPALARLLRLPYVPVTPTFPWLGPLGLVPLPSKWLIEFGEPIPTDGYAPSDADDPLVVFELSDHVRSTIQRDLDALRARRTSIFW